MPAATAAPFSGSTAPRKASAAAVARAKLRRWKGPVAARSTPGPGSSGAITRVAARSAATRSARARTSGETRPRTRVEASLSTASFSAAISCSVSPRYSVWWRPTEVRTVTREGIVLVASRRPPRPASIAAALTRARARATKVAAVAASNSVTASSFSSVRLTPSAAAATWATASAHASGAISSPRISVRSVQREVCGDRQAPEVTPWASSSAATIRVTEDLPLVPTTWTEAKRRCGRPSAVVSFHIRSRPSFQPTASRSSRYLSGSNPSGSGSAGSGTALAEFGEFRAVALQLAALFLDHDRRRLGDEALVGEFALTAVDLGDQLLAALAEALFDRARVELVRF